MVAEGVAVSRARAVSCDAVTDTDASWLDALRGKFLVFEGPDGSGKTTQLERLIERASDADIPVRRVREPGGTPVGEQIRDILLGPDHRSMSVRAEMLLYMASRAELIEREVRPALARGELVVSDRFVLSTIVYQGYAKGLPIEEILDVARVVCGEYGASDAAWPDATLVFSLPAATAASSLNPLFDRMEQTDDGFQQRLREGYKEQATLHPKWYLKIDARGSKDQVQARVERALADRFA